MDPSLEMGMGMAYSFLSLFSFLSFLGCSTTTR